jgi:serine/threonine-protein kinase
MGPGTQIERGYARIVVEGRIGSGAMGIVHRAWMFYAPNGPRAGEPPIPIALKQLKAQASLNAEIRSLFLNEAEALSRLSHPNVVKFYDLFEWTPPPRTMKTSPMSIAQPASLGVMSARPASTPAGTLTLAMELVDGATLEEVIARNVARARLAGAGALPGLPFQRAFAYFEQLLGALAAAHALGIVHRDIKPSNLMIRKDGVVKLTDFGIAHLRARPAADGDKESLAPGTGAYMAPEQVLGAPVDGRADLYSASILFYEMLTGRTPFLVEGKSELMVRMEQVEVPPPPIRSFLPQAPPVLDALFARALAKDPAARFPSAIELGNAFVTGLAIPASRGWHAEIEMAKLARESAPRKLATVRVELEQSYATLIGPPPAR